MRLITLLFLLSCMLSSYSQDLNAYHDYRNYFIIFDEGQTIPIQHVAVNEFAIGDKCIVFADHNNHYKLYYNGTVYDLAQYISEYKLTDNLCAFKAADQLYVFDNGLRKLLTAKDARYEAGDNIVVFYDEIDHMLKAYYNGEIIEMEDALSDVPLTNFKAGDNIAAYLDNRNYLKVLTDGRVEEVIYYSSRIRYDVGGSLMVYVDPSDNTFYVYDQGEAIPLEPFPPKSYKLGDDFVAYIDNTGTFKFYKNSYKETILGFEPDFYLVKDNLIVYSDQNYFNVYYNNRSYTLEDYIPSDYQYDHNSVAYKDVKGNLKLFKEGKILTVTYEKVSQYKLAGNTLYYEEGIETDKVYY